MNTATTMTTTIARIFTGKVEDERKRQIAKGYDEAHDDSHGLDHLLLLATRYAARGAHVKSAAMITAAREYAHRNGLTADFQPNPDLERHFDAEGNPS